MKLLNNIIRKGEFFFTPWLMTMQTPHCCHGMNRMS